MALVKCPECGKEVSDTAYACPNCGYSVKVHFDNLKRKKQAEIRKKQLEVEKRNKQVQLEKEYEDRVSKVPMPNKPKFSKVGIVYLLITSLLVMVSSLPNSKQEFQIKQCVFYITLFVVLPLCIYIYFLKKQINDYNLIKKNFRKYQEHVIKKQDVERARKQACISTQIAINQVRCPKCGSTNIQLIPRKWSLLTGFMTNKVDRICVNCKNRF